MNKNVERLYNGIIKENPTFVLMLGMCPTLAVTSSAINGLGMGLSTTVVLILSNLLISAFRKVIPGGVRMPAYIVIVASLVTVVQFIMEAYTPRVSWCRTAFRFPGTFFKLVYTDHNFRNGTWSIPCTFFPRSRNEHHP